MRKKSGFTLLEILIVIGIIAILLAILVPRYLNARYQAQDDASATAARVIYIDQINEQISKFALNRRWGAAYNQNYLNGKVQVQLENQPYDNVYRYANPFSGSRRVVLSSSLPSGASIRPAVFITNSQTYSYSRLRTTTKVPALQGTVVFYVRNNDPEIYVYYINSRQVKSSSTYGGR